MVGSVGKNSETPDELGILLVGVVSHDNVIPDTRFALGSGGTRWTLIDFDHIGTDRMGLR